MAQAFTSTNPGVCSQSLGEDRVVSNRELGIEQMIVSPVEFAKAYVLAVEIHCPAGVRRIIQPYETAKVVRIDPLDRLVGDIDDGEVEPQRRDNTARKHRGRENPGSCPQVLAAAEIDARCEDHQLDGNHKQLSVQLMQVDPERPGIPFREVINVESQLESKRDGWYREKELEVCLPDKQVGHCKHHEGTKQVVPVLERQ